MFNSTISSIKVIYPKQIFNIVSGLGFSGKSYVNNSDHFYYKFGKFYQQKQARNINVFVKYAHLPYFGKKVDNRTNIGCYKKFVKIAWIHFDYRSKKAAKNFNSMCQCNQESSLIVAILILGTMNQYINRYWIYPKIQ